MRTLLREALGLISILVFMSVVITAAQIRVKPTHDPISPDYWGAR